MGDPLEVIDPGPDVDQLFSLSLGLVQGRYQFFSFHLYSRSPCVDAAAALSDTAAHHVAIMKRPWRSLHSLCALNLHSLCALVSFCYYAQH